jgi:hypothetical protein
MSIRYQSAIGPLLLLLLLALLPGVTPAGQAANTIDQAGPAVDVSGTVLLPDGITPAAAALVWLAPLTPEGEFDSARQRYDYADSSGGFSFASVSPGSYGLQITPPNNQPTARVLRGYTFVVPDGTAPVALGPINLPLAVKRLTGSVQLSGAALAGVDVYAYLPNTGSARYASTAADGSFGIGLEPGEWRVYVANEPGEPWQFVDAESLVSFADDTSLQTPTLALTVQPTVGTITGRVLKPDGQPLPLPPPGSDSYYPYVYISGANRSFFRYESLDATGAFTMPVVADTYTLYTAIDEAYYQIYGPPPSRLVTTGAGETNVGVLTLELRDSRLTGMVRDEAGAPLANVPVEASREGGFLQSTYTDSNGIYSLKLAAATWDIAVFPHPSLGFLEASSYQQVTTTTGVTTTLDFDLTRGANTLYGSFVAAGDPATPLTDVRGWAYARDAASDEYVAWDYVEYGSFTLNVPAGELLVGVLLAPGSHYSLAGEEQFDSQQVLQTAGALGPAAADALELAPFEQKVLVAPAAPGEPAAVAAVRLTLRINDATISGRVLDQAGNPVTGVPVVVGLTPARAGDAWQWADVDQSTGGYSIPVSAGTWFLSFFVDDDSSPYNAPFSDPIAVTVAGGGAATQDVVLQKLDGVVRGTVRDEAGNPIAGQLVWVSSPFFTAAAETAGDGSYAIAVPLLNPDGSAASYELGGDFTCENLTSCFFDSDPITLTPAALLRSGPPSLDQTTSGDIVATKATGGAILRGRLVRGGTAYASKVVKDGKINGVTINKDSTDGNGVFEVLLTYRGSGPAEYDGYLETGSKRIEVENVDRPNLVAGPPQAWQAVELPAFELDPTEGLPAGVSAQFDNASGWSTTLSDGMRIEIAPGSVPLASNEGGSVRVTVSPTINIYGTGQFAEASWYGYDINLTAVSSNRLIGEELLAPARLVLRYGGQDYSLNDLRETQLRPARLADERWTAAAAFVLDRSANKVTVQTKTLGTWALVQERSACAGCVYLPIVRR